jgi:Acetyltransferase (GNAT) domain
MIEFRTREQINNTAWNDLIERSSNGLIYARTCFLDQLSPGWSALVLGNYEAVMPLTCRRKYGINYLFQPSFLQQLGIFGNFDEQIVKDFIDTASRNFKFGEICLNHSNTLNGVTARQNFIIPLQRHYEAIAAAFSTPHTKNLKRAANAGLRYKQSNALEANINKNYQLYGERFDSVTRSHYQALNEIARQNPGYFLSREVWKDDEQLASSVCLFDGRRIYFILSSVTEAGKKNQANHFLVDHIIREFAGRDLVLDFEGSDIPGIAEFYSGFGAVDQPYYFLKWNSLPWIYRIFKK